MNPLKPHLLMSASCLAGCWLGAALDQLHSGGALWRSLCLQPGWPSAPQLLLRLHLLPISFAASLGLPLLAYGLALRRIGLAPMALCLAAAVLSFAPGIGLCRWSGQLGYMFNTSLPGMLLIESLVLVAVQAALCVFWAAWRSGQTTHSFPVT